MIVRPLLSHPLPPTSPPLNHLSHAIVLVELVLAGTLQFEITIIFVVRLNNAFRVRQIILRYKFAGIVTTRFCYMAYF